MTPIANSETKGVRSNYSLYLMLRSPLLYWRSRQGFMWMLALFRLIVIAAILLRFWTTGNLDRLISVWFGPVYLLLAIAILIIVYFHPNYSQIDRPAFYLFMVVADVIAIVGALFLTRNHWSELYLLLLLPLILTSHYFPRRGQSVFVSAAIIASYAAALFLIGNGITGNEVPAGEIFLIWASRSFFLLCATWVYRIQANFPATNETRIISPERARARLEDMLRDFRQSVAYDTISVQILYRDRLQIVACHGFENQSEIYQIEFPATDPRYPNHLVMKTHKRQILDPDDYPSFKEPRYHADHIETWLGVPLISPTTGECFGLISVDSTHKNSYTWWDGVRASWFAMKTSAFLVEATLGPAALTQATKREDLLKTLQAWAQLFRPKVTADWADDLQAARELVRFGEKIFHVEDCSIYFLRHKIEEGEKIRVLHLVASSAIPPEIFPMNESQVTGHHGDGLTGLAVNRNRTINYGADQIERSPYRSKFTAHLPYLFSKRSRQIMIVPLRDSRGKTTGAIKLENRLGWPTENPFFPVEEHIFEVFAAMVSLMLENIRLRNFANRQSQNIHNLRSIIHNYALSPVAGLIQKTKTGRSRISGADCDVLENVRSTITYTKISLDSLLAESAENLLLEKEGLIPAIYEFVESLKTMMHAKAAANRIVFDIQDVRENLPFRVRVGMYNIAREGILNMVRHSRIEKRKKGYCKLSFYELEGIYHLQIEDNGAGFSPEEKLEQNHSFGLRDMYFQKDAIRRLCADADIEIESSEQKGTCIHVWATC